MSDDLRTVARFASPAEAAIARNALEAAGISAFVADELTLTTDPFLSGALNYIKVQVRTADLERAEAVLAEQSASLVSDIADQDGMLGEPATDEGSDDLPTETVGERRVRFAYRAALMGILACPPLLHIYSLGQLLLVAISGEDLGPRATRHFYVALLLNLAVIATAALIVLEIARW